MKFGRFRISRLNWIDWIKILVALDITTSGIGLLFGFPLHLFANIFGWVSRIFFGFLYIFVAFALFVRVLVSRGFLLKKEKRIFSQIRGHFLLNLKNAFTFILKCADKILLFFDEILDKLEFFFSKRKEEIREELNQITKNTPHTKD